MDFINGVQGGIQGMKFNPISNYNNYLKSNASFDVDTTNMAFENILNQQQSAMQDSSIQVKGGIEMNNFDDVLAKSTVQGIDGNQNTGNFIDSVSHSISSGLNSVNDKVKAADRAQEALAMGEDISVHDVMIAAEKASLSMQMAMQLRNKMMAAYNEISNIRV